MSELKLPAASGGGSISIKGPASSGSDVDLVDTSGNLNLADGKKLNVGDGDDLEISHTSNLSTIKNTHASGLAIRSDIVMLQNDAGDHDYLTTANETGVSLYYDNTKKFETWSEGCKGRGIAHAYGILDMSSGAHLDNDFGCGAVTEVETGIVTIALTNNLADNDAFVGVANTMPTATASQQFGFCEFMNNSTSSFYISARKVDNDAPSMAVADIDNLMFCIFDVA